MSQSADQARVPLPAALAAEIQSCGFFPELVIDLAETSLAGDEVLDHLLHLEATFDNDEVHRHLTLILRTATRMLIGHTDERRGRPVASRHLERVHPAISREFGGIDTGRAAP